MIGKKLVSLGCILAASLNLAGAAPIGYQLSDSEMELLDGARPLHESVRCRPCFNKRTNRAVCITRGRCERHYKFVGSKPLRNTGGPNDCVNVDEDISEMDNFPCMWRNEAEFREQNPGRSAGNPYTVRYRETKRSKKMAQLRRLMDFIQTERQLLDADLNDY